MIMYRALVISVKFQGSENELHPPSEFALYLHIFWPINNHSTSALYRDI